MPGILLRIRTLAAAGRVRFTYKALRELSSLGLGMDEADACDLMAALSARDFSERLLSEHTSEYLYVFKPVVAATTLYLKIIIRGECVVVSLHEDGESDD